MNISMIRKSFRTLTAIYSAKTLSRFKAEIALIKSILDIIEESLLRDSPLVIIQMCGDAETLIKALEICLDNQETKR